MRKTKEDFLEMLEQYKLIIFKVCNGYCSDPEEQKDLVQEVILQLWRSFDKYNAQYKLSTWVYRIALNVAISHFRKVSTRQKHTTSFDGAVLNIAEADDDNKNDDLRLLQVFLNQLQKLDKALMMLYLDGHSHEEIAQILDISKSNVGTKINRIKEKIRQQFKTTA